MAAKPTRFFTSRYFRVGAGLFVSVFALALVAREVDFWEVWAVLKKAHPSFIGLGLASVGVNGLSKVLRWRALLGKRGGRVGFVPLLGAILSGQLLNSIFPGRIGDVARVFVIGKDVGRAFVLGTIALEKVIETIAFAVMFLILLFLAPIPDWLEGSSWSLLAIVLLGSGLLAGAVYFRKQLTVFVIHLTERLPARLYSWLAPQLESGLSALKVLEGEGRLLWVVFLTAMVWGTAVFNNHATMRALEIQLPISASLLLLIGLQAAIVAAASPGAIGVFEYICVLTLGAFGVERTLALGYGLLLHALVLLPQVVGGMVALVGWGLRSPALLVNPGGE